MLRLDRRARRRVAGMMYRHLMVYYRHIDRKLEIFFWPAVDAFLFGAIGVYASKAGQSSTLALMLAGFVMAQIVWQSHIHLSRFFMQETWDWNVLYLMTRPIRTREVFVAAVGLTIMVTVVAITFVSATTAVSFGLHLLGIPPGVILLIPILMLLGWTTALFAVSLMARLGDKATNFVWALFGIIGPLSGSIVPVSTLPPGLRNAAVMLPTTHAYEAGRAIMFSHAFPARELALAGAGAVIAMCIAVATLTRSMKVFRDRGLISRYM